MKRVLFKERSIVTLQPHKHSIRFSSIHVPSIPIITVLKTSICKLTVLPPV